MKDPWEANWQIEKRLGRGGQGNTFLVTSVKSEEQAVLKTLRSKRSSKARRRMSREVASLRTLKPAGGKVPEVFDDNVGNFADVDVPLYLVMEYIPGPTLREEILDHGPFSLDGAIDFALDLCSTIKVAHQESVFHRDLKPENIVLRKADKADVVVLDYGLSFNSGDESPLTSIDERIGNRFLSLPEESVPGENRRDPRSDLTKIWALFYYAISGVEPSQLMDSAGKLPHQRGRMPTDDDRLEVISSYLDRAFSPDIGARFQTADEIEKALTRLKTGEFKAVSDIAASARRLSAHLRSTIPKLKRDTMKAVAAKFVAAVKDHWNRIPHLGEFKLTFANVAGLGGFSSEPLAAFQTIVSTERFQPRRAFRYALIAEEGQIVVYRQVAPAERSGGIRFSGSWDKVDSFDGKQEASPSIVNNDLAGLINRGIREISEEIQIS